MPDAAVHMVKIYQYQTIVIEDRGHLTDAEFLQALNDMGRTGAGEIKCPLCGENDGHAKANGWKHKEEQAMGSSKLAVLLEREIAISKCPTKEFRSRNFI